MDTDVDCCIAGCGPAGAVLGLLLARAGVRVSVLEKHSDFLRDFRGDTIHPSTLEVLDELGLAERFLELPHSEVGAMALRFGAADALRIEFNRMGGKFPFIAFVPQWDFLEFVTAEASRYASFELIRDAELVDLLRDESGTITGVRFTKDGAERQLRAKLTIGADGRASRTREAAKLPLVETSPPMDVEWFRLSRQPGDSDEARLQAANGRIVGFFPRGEFWQIAYVIAKGADQQLRAAGLGALHDALGEAEPRYRERARQELDSWDKVKLLTVRSDRLRRWYRPGYLAIGDAAHAMSPVAGVGINMAIQDAVAAANLLWRPLRSGTPSTRTLSRVQRQRELTIRIVQGMQALVQQRVLAPSLGGAEFKLPTIARLVMLVPWIRLVPARLVAYGVVRPHVRVPELATKRDQVLATSGTPPASH